MLTIRLQASVIAVEVDVQIGTFSLRMPRDISRAIEHARTITKRLRTSVCDLV